MPGMEAGGEMALKQTQSWAECLGGATSPSAPPSFPWVIGRGSVDITLEGRQMLGPGFVHNHQLKRRWHTEARSSMCCSWALVLPPIAVLPEIRLRPKIYLQIPWPYIASFFSD